MLKIKEILTQEHQYRAKNIPVIPRSRGLAARPSRVLAFYSVQRKIRDCSQSNLDDAFSVIAIWTELYNKDETVRNWLFEYH